MRRSLASRVEVHTLLKLIAIVAGLILAARALSQRTAPAEPSGQPDPAERISEESAEQELRTPTS